MQVKRWLARHGQGVNSEEEMVEYDPGEVTDNEVETGEVCED